MERYIRRLEFQISKVTQILVFGVFNLRDTYIRDSSMWIVCYWQVEELYESYCIQWRLCQGALNMKRAFSLSPSSRQSRESLLELSRNHRHSLEVKSDISNTIICDEDALSKHCRWTFYKVRDSHTHTSLPAGHVCNGRGTRDPAGRATNQNERYKTHTICRNLNFRGTSVYEIF